MDVRQATGKAGEAVARAYLERTGWTILHTNWRSRLGEIDIVAQKQGEPYIAIIEVRSKRSVTYGTAAESVDYRKQQKLRRLGLQYMKQHRLWNQPIRFDVITVYFPPNNGTPQIVHIPAAF